MGIEFGIWGIGLFLWSLAVFLLRKKKKFKDNSSATLFAVMGIFWPIIIIAGACILFTVAFVYLLVGTLTCLTFIGNLILKKGKIDD